MENLLISLQNLAMNIVGFMVGSHDKDSTGVMDLDHNLVLQQSRVQELNWGIFLRIRIRSLPPLQ